MPRLRAILMLGRIAHDSTLKTLAVKSADAPFKHGARHDVLIEKRAAHHPMMDALIEMREDLGKKTETRHFWCENKLCNGIVTGEYKSIDEKELSNDDAALLAKVRRRNESMLQVGFEYAERKKLLTAFAIRERTKRIAQSAPQPLLEPA